MRRSGAARLQSSEAKKRNSLSRWKCALVAEVAERARRAFEVKLGTVLDGKQALRFTGEE